MPLLLNTLMLLLVLGTVPSGARSLFYRTAGASTSNLHGWMLTVEYSGQFTMYADPVYPSSSSTYPSPSSSTYPSPSTSSLSSSTYPSPSTSSPSSSTYPSPSTSPPSSTYPSPSTSPPSSSTYYPSPSTSSPSSSTYPSPSSSTYPSPSTSSLSSSTYPSPSTSSPSSSTYPSPSTSPPSSSTYPSPSTSPPSSTYPSPSTSPPSSSTYPSPSTSSPSSSTYPYPASSPSLSSTTFSPTTPYPYSPTPSPGLSALTVCLRYMAESGGDLTLFSLTQGYSWNLLLRSSLGGDRLSIQSGKLFSSYRPLYSVTTQRPWTGLCVTWEKATGVAQLWRDGSVSIRKRLFGQVTTGPPILNIFRFEGQVTDVEVWDRVLSQYEIMDYMSGYYYLGNPGNVLTWSKANYSSNKDILLEKIRYTRAFKPLRGKQSLPGSKRGKGKKFEWRKRRGNACRGE